MSKNLDRKQANSENFIGALPFAPEIIAVPIFFAVIGGIVIFQKLSTQEHGRKVSRKASCKKCRFFSNNKYLKCAVQPTIVLTEEAKNCPEYQPKEKKYFQFYKIYGHKQN
jgi:hypothetical protein